MKFLVLLALVGIVTCDNSKTQEKFVWDILKLPLTQAKIFTILVSKDVSYPTYNSVPQTAFSCSSKAQPGFYADMDAQCQAFHRCDQYMNVTSYLCVNSTVFNQVTLVSDSWFNVDCDK